MACMYPQPTPAPILFLPTSVPINPFSLSQPLLTFPKPHHLHDESIHLSESSGIDDAKTRGENWKGCQKCWEFLRRLQMVLWMQRLGLSETCLSTHPSTCYNFNQHWQTWAWKMTITSSKTIEGIWQGADGSKSLTLWLEVWVGVRRKGDENMNDQHISPTHNGDINILPPSTPNISRP
jgi:hypothetical protein